jgi:hypothetical protein
VTRWRYNLYSGSADEPFHATYEEADGPGQRDEAGLPLNLAVWLRIALDDERVQRIELVRQP